MNPITAGDVFWTSLGSLWPERNLLNLVIQRTERELGDVDDRIDAMASEIMALRSVVKTLVSAIREANVLNNETLDARVALALQEVQPPPAGKYRCVRCKSIVEPSTTTMTANGPVCDRCPPR